VVLRLNESFQLTPVDNEQAVEPVELAGEDEEEDEGGGEGEEAGARPPLRLEKDPQRIAAFNRWVVNQTNEGTRPLLGVLTSTDTAQPA